MRDNVMMCSIFLWQCSTFGVRRLVVERDVMGLVSKSFHVVAVHSELSLVELIAVHYLRVGVGDQVAAVGLVSSDGCC
jgi:hypothetical protein